MNYRADILSMPNIPKPLHGLNPRTIMGKGAWDIYRREVYKSTDYHCASCGVHKSSARLHKWLEAHEVFNIDYKKGIATLVEIVPLCHFCHSFIHSGLLRINARNKKVTPSHVRDVLTHGVCVLDGRDIYSGTVDLCRIVGVSIGMSKPYTSPTAIAGWSKWRMEWDGIEYKGRFSTLSQWQRHYERM